MPSMPDALGSIPSTRVCAPVQRVPADEAGEEAANSCESHNAKALGVYWAAAVLKREGRD